MYMYMECNDVHEHVPSIRLIMHDNQDRVACMDLVMSCDEVILYV